MNKILVCTDGSDYALVCCHYAAWLAGRSDAGIDLLYLTDIRRDFDIFNRIYGEYFSADNGPCRTTVEVNRLPTPIAIELKCIATAN